MGKVYKDLLLNLELIKLHENSFEQEIENFARKGELGPWEINGESNGFALVLRYSGCNLKCPLCYARKIAWNLRGNKFTYKECIHYLNYIQSNLIESKKRKYKRIVWVRFQGGEPLLNFKRIKFTLKLVKDVLDFIHKSKLNYYPITRAVIQTNGIWFAQVYDSELELETLFSDILESIINFGRIVFEVSFKSPTLTDQNHLLELQYRGYQNMLKLIKFGWDNGYSNIAIYPVAGLGPSIDYDQKYLIPIESSKLPEEVPLFHQSTWHKMFKSIYEEFVNNIVKNYAYKEFRENPKTLYGKKLPLEELEPCFFQTSWISDYSKNSSLDPPLSRLLLRTSKELDQKWKGLFSKYPNVINQIPISKDPNRLLGKVKEMQEYFYPSHPKGHYPYL